MQETIKDYYAMAIETVKAEHEDNAKQRLEKNDMIVINGHESYFRKPIASDYHKGTDLK